MWLGEQITERGIGNGISLIIFAGIVVGLAARDLRRSSSQIRTGDLHILIALLGVLVFMIAIVALDRLRRARAAPDSGPVRQARRRAAGLRRRRTRTCRCA